MTSTPEDLRRSLRSRAAELPASTTTIADLERRRTAARTRLLMAPTVVILLAAIAAAALINPSVPPAVQLSTGPSAFAAAAAETREAGTARYAFSQKVRVGNRPSGSATADGVVDLRSGAGRLVVAIGDQRIEMILGGPLTYQKYPADVLAQARIPTPWVAVDYSSLAKGGHSVAGLGTNTAPTSPAEGIEALEEGARGLYRGFREVGREEVRGVETVHFEGVVDLDRLPQDSRPEGSRIESRSIEIWIDLDGVLRRVRHATTLVGSGPTKASSVVTLEYFDFGVDLGDVAPPPADQVTTFNDPQEFAKRLMGTSGHGAIPTDAVADYCAARALLQAALDAPSPRREDLRTAITLLDRTIATVENTSPQDLTALSSLRALGASARLLVIATTTGDVAQLEDAKRKTRDSVTRMSATC